jgi:enoyl-CoA hydratase/carnithine racemase
VATTLDHRDGIAVLNLGDDENRLSPGRLDAIHAFLDSAETDARGLVTVGTGKFYSNGLDQDWLAHNDDQADWYVGGLQEVLARVLTFPLPTIAAVNGHAFGGGAMFAMAHDYRLMRSDRGYVCFPEVDIGFSFTPGMAALIQAKLPARTALDAMTTGRRFTGVEAQAAGLVDGVETEDELLAASIDRLALITGKDPHIVGSIKTTMYESVIGALRR